MAELFTEEAVGLEASVVRFSQFFPEWNRRKKHTGTPSTTGTPGFTGTPGTTGTPSTSGALSGVSGSRACLGWSVAAKHS